YDVIEARNGLEALIRAATASPPDLITLDIEMPKLNGFDTCRKLRDASYARFFKNSDDHRVPIIFITGNDTLEDRKKGFELGAVDFISKPFQKGEILKAVNKILRQSVTHQGICALVADDNVVARKIISLCLSREGIDVHEAEDGQKAYEIITQGLDRIDIVITDLMMPEMDGMQLCRQIRQGLGMLDIPIIVLTAMSDLSEILEVFKVGASDYLIKPYAKEELLARISVHIERNRINRELRTTIRMLKEANEKIEKLSIMDPLTGCFNRGYLNSQLAKEIKRAVRYGKPLSIILSDIDHFKRVNDVYGHQAGDHVLIRFVEMIQHVLRNDVDWIGRYGGEEFLIVLPDTPVANATTVAEKLRKAVSCEPIPWDNHEIAITSSFGLTGFDSVQESNGPLVEKMLKFADENLYEAKKNGRNQVVIKPY
ncbi:MAG: response regulator, partial [Desulfatirhabdiaceae bacterium]